ncbi:MAG: hypothetical protein NXI31_26440 [bacterium]|nr:hypothetical protein [bacterium]
MRVHTSAVLGLLFFALPSSAAAQDPEPEANYQLELGPLIDSMAGHPEDPQLPEGQLGASDDVLLATSPMDIAELLRSGIDFARTEGRSPRFLFALGRAALAHGYASAAERLLTDAAAGGSLAATAHLGLLAESRQRFEVAGRLLQQAVDGGFAPPAIADALRRVRFARFDPTAFRRSDFIGALHRGEGLRELQGLFGLTYIAEMATFLTSDQVLFLTEDPRLLLEIDPALPYYAAKRVLRSPQATREAMSNSPLAAMGDMLMTMAEKRRSGAGILEEATSAFTAGAERMEPIELLKKRAAQDGRRLAILYGQNPAAFRQIAANMARVVGLGGGASQAPAKNRSKTSHPQVAPQSGSRWSQPQRDGSSAQPRAGGRRSSARRGRAGEPHQGRPGLKERVEADMRRREAEAKQRRQEHPEVELYAATIPDIESLCRRVTEHFGEPREVVFRTWKPNVVCVARANRDGAVSRWDLDRGVGSTALHAQLRQLDPGRGSHGDLVVAVMTATRWFPNIKGSFSSRTAERPGMGWMTPNTLTLAEVESAHRAWQGRGTGDAHFTFSRGEDRYLVRELAKGLDVLRFDPPTVQQMGQIADSYAAQLAGLERLRDRLPAQQWQRLQASRRTTFEKMMAPGLQALPAVAALGITSVAELSPVLAALRAAKPLTEARR